MNKIKIWIASCCLITLSTLGFAAEVSRVSQSPELKSRAHIFKLTGIIETPINSAWGLVGENFDHNIKFDLDAVQTEFLDATVPQVGSKRRTIDKDGKYTDVEITEFSKKERYVAWEIIQTDVVKLETAFFSYRLESIDSNKTRITQEVGIRLKNPVMHAMAKRVLPDYFITELSIIKHILENDVEKNDLASKEYKRRYGDEIKLEIL